MPKSTQTSQVTDTEELVPDIETPAKFWCIKTQDFLFMELSVGLILYPGSRAVLTDLQYGTIPEYAFKMITSEEITEKEYQALIGQQGILGLP